MTTEHEPQPGDRPIEPDQAAPTAPDIWDPNERVGDIYAAQINDAGQVVGAERLAADDSDPNQAEQPPESRPKIWVGSWLDYNNGVLHGQWITADRDDGEVWADIRTMLASSPTAATTGEMAEDWGIFDYENFGPLRIDEQESVAWVTKVGRGIAGHGPAFAAWAAVMEDEALLDGFDDAYLGHHDSLEAYAEQLVSDLGYDDLLDQTLPDSLRRYVRIDTAALATDLQAGGDVHAVPADDGGVWLFNGNG